MSTNKPLVCICCKKSYQMPAFLTPPEVKPWAEYGVCEACDTVVAAGRFEDQFIGQLSELVGKGSNDVADEEETHPLEAKKVRSPRSKKAPAPVQAPEPVIEVKPTPDPVFVMPKVLTPAAQAQLSLF